MTDINKETVYVTINSARRIPFLNASGPIQTPISILKTVAAQLKALGYPVKEHPYVGINPATGNRSVMTEESFVALKAGQLVEVETTDPAPALVPTADDAPPALSEVVIVEQPKEIVEETDPTEESEEPLDETEETTDETSEETSEETTDETSADDTTEEETETSDETSEETTDTDEAEELDVYEYAVYEGWSKQLLINYLRKAEDFLPEDVRKETNSANKVRLLEIIKQYIIDAA